MIIFPAIDLFEGKAVRLLRGEYDKMTVYSDDPASLALEEGAALLFAVGFVGLYHELPGGCALGLFFHLFFFFLF